MDSPGAHPANLSQYWLLSNRWFERRRRRKTSTRHSRQLCFSYVYSCLLPQEGSHYLPRGSLAVDRQQLPPAGACRSEFWDTTLRSNSAVNAVSASRCDNGLRRFAFLGVRWKRVHRHNGREGALDLWGDGCARRHLLGQSSRAAFKSGPKRRAVARRIGLLEWHGVAAAPPAAAAIDDSAIPHPLHRCHQRNS
jgi:hypothetical protein